MEVFVLGGQMKVFVWNFIKVKRIIAFILVLTVSVGITLGLLFTVDAYLYPAVDADNEPDERVIILDAGHGGEDSGAVGVNGVLEKDLNLMIAEALKAELEAKGFTVVMTRSEDKMLYSEDENIKGMRKLSDLKNRVKVAEQYPNSLFISLHMNSFGAAQYSGLQVYYAEDDNGSAALANAIQASVKNTLQPQNNRVTKCGKDLYLLEKSPVTSVLVECGFLSNEEECKKLSEKEYQKELSFAIVCGIINYIELINS